MVFDSMQIMRSGSFGEQIGHVFDCLFYNPLLLSATADGLRRDTLAERGEQTRRTNARRVRPRLAG